MAQSPHRYQWFKQIAESNACDAAHRKRTPRQTTEEAQMIAAYIAKHGVKKIPPGGFPEEIKARDESIKSKMRNRTQKSQARRAQTNANRRLMEGKTTLDTRPNTNSPVTQLPAELVAQRNREKLNTQAAQRLVRDASIMKGHAAGLTNEALAKKTGLTDVRVAQIIRREKTQALV